MKRIATAHIAALRERIDLLAELGHTIRLAGHDGAHSGGSEQLVGHFKDLERDRYFANMAAHFQ